MTVRFSNQLVADLIQPFWAAWQAGEFMTDASAVAGTHRQRGLAWVRQAGGVRPRRGRGRGWGWCLSPSIPGLQGGEGVSTRRAGPLASSPPLNVPECRPAMFGKGRENVDSD